MICYDKNKHDTPGVKDYHGDEREGIGAFGVCLFCAVVGAAMLIAALIAWGVK